MTYPLWSGINSDWVDSTEINGAAPTPSIITSGFSAAVIPVLMGLHPGMYSEVMRVRPEERRLAVIAETRTFNLEHENKELAVLPENRVMTVERSRKRYP